MTTQTTTTSPFPVISTMANPWQAVQSMGTLRSPRPVHYWLGLVRTQKAGLADRSVQNMGDMTMNVADNKGRAGL